jgi:hypothetical protein
MKRLINICLLLSFLLGYLEWGKTHSLFIFQGEAEIILKAKNNLRSILHPLILIPFLGQILLLYTVFQPTVSRVLSLTGLACLSILMLLLFIVGLLTLNLKIACSTLPFIITGIFALRYHRKNAANVQ